MIDYPAWVCQACGEKHGQRECGLATWHEDVCGVCGKTAMVTEPRDFGHLKPTWKADALADALAEGGEG